MPLCIPWARKKRAHSPLRTLGLESAHSAKSVDEQSTTVIGGNGWLAFKEALKTLKDMSSGPLIPLKTALVGVIAVMDHVEKVSGAQADFFKLAHKVDTLKQIFHPYQFWKDLPPVLYDRLDDILKDLGSINNDIESKTRRGLVQRTLAAFNDVKDIVDLGENIVTLPEKFKVGALLNMELKVEDMAKDNALNKLKHVSSAGILALNQKGCMEGTRVPLLNDLKQWSRDPTSHRVFWLDGMAGTGKSAIAQSLARFLHDNWLLGGSFFCLRGHESRSNVRRILPTLAWYLARRDMHYRASLLHILRDTPDIVDYAVERQVEYLLEKPFCNVSRTTRPPLVLVVDALDECADAEEVQELLDKLLSVSNLPVKFFLTSRPERHIRTQFEFSELSVHRILRLHDIEKDIVEGDIRLYLRKRLEDIRTSSRFPGSFPSEWPSSRDINTLTCLAGKLFIYAFTAIKFIECNPVERLKTLTGFAVDAGRPFHRALDDMYTLVLSAALDPDECTDKDIRTTKRTLAAILIVRAPLPLSDLGRVLMVDPYEIRMCLDRTHAVLNVPPDDEHGVVSTFHASFADFLTTSGRAPENMRITLNAAHRDLANGCLRIMNSELHFNIANCQTSYLLNSEQNLGTVSGSLQYSCLHWARHMFEANGAATLLEDLENFLFGKFLFWLEVLSITGTAGLMSSIIRRALTAIQKMPSTRQDLATFLDDANDFVIRFREVIESSVPHIYLSALPSLDRTSKIAEVFRRKYPFTIKVAPQDVEQQRKILLDLRGHSYSVSSATFSSDGRRIASGSYDNTARIWDARTGENVMNPLNGHTKSVTSVDFSPDGKRIVSGSFDNTIRIWDAKTGVEVMTLDGHTSTVWSIAFSPDGMWIVSGSSDYTIQIWNARTGAKVIKPLNGHTGTVQAVGFSPDSKHIVSGSFDKTIRIWDVWTGEEVMKPLNGHTRAVMSVGFSPDGKRIVSGSEDQTIRIWDARTGDEVMNPLYGHTGGVLSVGFSPDSKRIVSGSFDDTIRIWDAKTGDEVMKPLNGHTHIVWSVSFSPDGMSIVSASSDKTIRIWDARTEDEDMKPLKGQIGAVESVCFSPDAMRIVSGSDKTIRIWDATTGDEVMEPLNGHTRAVSSVGFSSDGMRIVSGSYDKTIRIWDARTGVRVMNPLNGHTDSVRSVGFSPDWMRIVSGSDDGTIRIWDASTGEEVMDPLNGHTGSVRSVGFSPDGERIVSGSSDYTIRIWYASTGDEVMDPLNGHTGSVWAVGFSPDGKRIVSGSLDKTIRIWDATTGGEVMKPLKGHSDVVTSVGFSPDGKRIVSGSFDKTIRVWDARTGDEVMKPLNGHPRAVTSVGFSPDGMGIVSGSEDRTIRFWDARTGNEDTVASVGSSPNMTSLTSISESRLQSDGWIRGPSGEFFFWVLPEWHTNFVWPPCILHIAESRVLVDLRNYVHGIDWVNCYNL